MGAYHSWMAFGTCWQVSTFSSAFLQSDCFSLHFCKVIHSAWMRTYTLQCFYEHAYSVVSNKSHVSEAKWNSLIAPVPSWLQNVSKCGRTHASKKPSIISAELKEAGENCQSILSMHIMNSTEGAFGMDAFDHIIITHADTYKLTALHFGWLCTRWLWPEIKALPLVIFITPL